MRQAAIALLAVPVLVVVYAALAAASVGGRLRRSKAIRVSVALGLALIVGIGIVGTGRPSPAVATAPVPIVPLTPAAFTTQVVTDRALTEPVSIRFSTAMDPASVAAAVTVEPADTRCAGVGRDRYRLDDRAPRPLGRRHSPHDHRPARRPGPIRTATRQPGPRGIPDP